MTSRRQTLQYLASLSALSAGGCCVRGYPENGVEPGFRAAIGVPAYMSPAPSRQLLSDRPGVVDAHAHFFNASDVPVRGFLGKSFGHTFGGAAQLLIKALAVIAEKIAKAAPTAAEEIAMLEAFEATLEGRDTTAMARQKWQQEVTRQRRAAADRVASSTRDSKFIRLYKQTTTRSRGGPPSTSNDAISADEVLDVVDRLERRDTQSASACRTRRGMTDAEVADGILGFLFYLLAHRAVNIAAYEQGYTTGTDELKVETALGALVDFDYWLKCPPASSHDDQVQLHKLLSQRCGAYMRPLVAYNPWTDIKLDGEGLARVRKAIATGVFVGVKIYPPMGFYPADNAGNPIATKEKRPDPAQLDRRLGAFFDYCRDNGVPVMSHTSHSNGRDHAHDHFGGPQGWRRLLEKHAGNGRPLRLNFGHFGGEVYKTWTGDFAKLMSDYPGQSLYADLGFWDELQCRDGAGGQTCRRVRARLKQALATGIGNGATAADRLMYGSDWHMLSRTRCWWDYTREIYDSIVEVSDAATARKIFHDNACTLFKLETPEYRKHAAES